MKTPIKPTRRSATPFYWWRRYRTHKPLPTKASLIDKIDNDDFEYSPFFDQARWELEWMSDEQKLFINEYQGKNHMADILYLDIEKRGRKRYNKLFEDATNDERDRMDRLGRGLAKEFKLDLDKVRDIINIFEGTTKQLYFYVADNAGVNIDTFHKLKQCHYSGLPSPNSY